jgi:hypothetical protein
MIKQRGLAGKTNINLGLLISGGSTWIKNPNRWITGNIADGGTIAHNVGLIPTIYDVKATLAGEYARVTAVDINNLTVAIKTFAGAAGTSQPLICYAGFHSD